MVLLGARVDAVQDVGKHLHHVVANPHIADLGHRDQFVELAHVRLVGVSAHGLDVRQLGLGYFDVPYETHYCLLVLAHLDRVTLDNHPIVDCYLIDPACARLDVALARLGAMLFG